MYVWLLALGVLVPTIINGQDAPAWLAASALVAFTGLYVATTWLALMHPARIWPRAAAYAGLASVTIAAALHFSQGWLLLFVFLSVATAVSLPTAWAVGGVVVVSAVTTLVAFDNPAVTGWPLAWVFGPLFGGLLNIYVLRTQRLIAELRATRREMARLAVEEERLRFARDLHDLLGHTLSLIVVKAEAVRRLAPRDPQAAAGQASDIEAVGRQALVEVREAVTGYRRGGLAAELDGARHALDDAGIEAIIQVDDPALPPEVDRLLGWALREGITNVIRHSHATRCSVRLGEGLGQVMLEICDDGVGGGEAWGSGLRGLAERVAAAGGRLAAGASPSGGFRLRVDVSLTSPSGHRPEVGA